MSQIATKENGGVVARPLKILIPLIKDDFEKAEQAGMSYYRAAGEKLNEARDGSFDGRSSEFYDWAEKTFGKKRTQLRTYMALGAPEVRKSFISQREFQRAQGQHRPIGPGTRIHREWTAPVDVIAHKAFDDARRLAQEASLTRKQEKDADRKLALRLIDIGFKVLAQELHPDKGGSRDAMARLNRVRNQLKECIGE